LTADLTEQRNAMLREQLPALPALIAETAAQANVPGVSVGVMYGDEVEVFVHGSANIDAGIDVTPDTVFQIGSNTKLWTATLAMQLVEAGELSLDAPVTTYVPEFSLAHADAKTVTIKHLLTHTGGFLGDYFGGPTTATIADFVDEMATIEQLHPVGAMWSYCNSGWVLLGRVIEKVTGEDYATALRTRLLDPIGDRFTHVRLEDIVRFRVANGYLPNPETGELDMAPYYLMAACAPAGSVPVSTPADVLRFVRMHLDGGRAEDGTQVLSAEAVAQMQQPQADVPAGALGRTTAWGLGWSLRTLNDGQRVLGHGGGTPSGMVSTLEVVPDRRLAVVVLANSAGGALVGQKVVEHVFGELAGATLDPDPVELPDPPISLDWTLYAGTYGAGGATLEVAPAVEHDGLLVTATADDAPGSPPAQIMPLVALSETRFAVPIPGVNASITFLGLDDSGRPGYLFAGRLYPRRD
jgi:CubicO group peptidase (beta-lactamase class C family)